MRAGGQSACQNRPIPSCREDCRSYMTLDNREFRNALGRFATGVCIITAHPQGMDPFGMTVNSFTSLSMEPPLVLWNLQNDSECYEAFGGVDHFCVNVLASDQMELSNRYARKGDHDLHPEHFTEGSHGCPVLHGALTSFECEKWQTVEAGDHLILIGKVLGMLSRTEGEPLLFYGGKYRELG